MGSNRTQGRTPTSVELIQTKERRHVSKESPLGTGRMTGHIACGRTLYRDEEEQNGAAYGEPMCHDLCSVAKDHGGGRIKD